MSTPSWPQGSLDGSRSDEHLDAIAVDHHGIAIHRHAAAELAMRGVVAGRGARWCSALPRSLTATIWISLVRLRFVQRAQCVAADASVTIDAYLDRHVVFRSFRSEQFEYGLLQLARASGRSACSRSAALPEAPKLSMPSTRPLLPTYFHHSAVAPASMATRRVTAAGSTDSRYAASWRVECIGAGHGDQPHAAARCIQRVDRRGRDGHFGTGGNHDGFGRRRPVRSACSRRACMVMPCSRVRGCCGRA